MSGFVALSRLRRPASSWAAAWSSSERGHPFADSMKSNGWRSRSVFMLARRPLPRALWQL